MTDAQIAHLPAPRAELRPSMPHALGPAEKAAIVIVALGADAAGGLLREMGEGAVRRFARAVSGMRQIPQEEVAGVVSEFLDGLGDEMTVRGGAHAARRFLGQVMDEEALTRIMEDLDGRDGRSIWTRLAGAADAPFATWLQTEHPQLVCVILSKLRSDQAARLLERLDPAFARDVVLRMGKAPRVEAGAMDLVTELIERDFLSATERTQGMRKPTEIIAGLMNHVSGEAREAFLRHMDEAQPKLAQEVQRVMFTFSDIPDRVAARDVSLVVKEVEEQALLTALKAAGTTGDRAAAFILGNIPKRLSERLAEEVAEMPEVRRKEGEAAQSEVVQAIQALARSGEIRLIELDEEQ